MITFAGKQYSHRGFLVGCDSNIPANFRRQVLLRETKLYWVTEDARKYGKLDGYPIPRTDWPIYKLQIASIKAIE